MLVYGDHGFEARRRTIWYFRWMRSSLAAMCVLSLAACATSKPAVTMSDPVAEPCPNSTNTCVTTKLCSYDAKNDCTLCHCDSALGDTPDVGGVPPIH